jgi:protein gp37
MSNHSKIEWTDATWNPVRGCTMISPGCKHCYAEAVAERFRGTPGNAYELGFDPRLVPAQLLVPFRWEKPRMVFVNSMSDLFLELVPDDYIAAVVDVMMRADWHTFQVLTKRADRMAALLQGPLADAALAPNIWWGVSVEDQKHGYPRIEALRASSARTKFLSIEPLLEDVAPIDLDTIDWVIVGGESGPHARPMDPDWVRYVRDACIEAGVPFFFKQWGGTNKKKAGRLLDGRTHDGMPVRITKPYPGCAEAQARMAQVDVEVWKGRELLVVPGDLQQPCAEGRS